MLDVRQESGTIATVTPYMKAKKAHKKQHENGLAVYTSDLSKLISDTGGNLLVTMALEGCTLAEKTLVAAFIPNLLRFIRTAPKSVLDSVAGLASEPKTPPKSPEAPPSDA